MTVPPIQAATRLVPVTVTYLAMRERACLPPEKPQVPTGAAVQLLRPCPLADYRMLYDKVGSPWHWLERKRMGDPQLQAILDDPRVEVHLLTVNGRAAGYAELDSRRDSTVDLAYFGIMPEYIGHKLGPWLPYEAVERAWTKRPVVVTVNTCTLDHPAALPLYQRLGFRPIGERSIYFDIG